MTWEQLQRLRQEARQRIEARLAALSPRAGDGCFVNGNLIGLEFDSRTQQAEAETWLLGIWITAKVEVITFLEGNNQRFEESIGPVLFCWQERVARNNQELFNRATVAGILSIGFTLNKEETAGVQRRVQARVEPRAFEPVAGWEAMSDEDLHRRSWFAGDKIVTFEHVVSAENSTDIGQVAAVNEVRAIRGGAFYSPQPVVGNEFYALRVTKIEHAP